MTNLRKISLILILLTFIIWIGWDIVLVIKNEKTLSQDLLSFSKSNQWFSYLMGFLSGHWFFPKKVNFKHGWIVAFIIMGIIGLFDLYCLITGFNNQILRFQGTWFLVGLVAGSYLWGQGDGSSPL